MDRLLTARVRRLLLRAGWAPLAVVGFHAGAAALFGHAPRLDPAMHFLGGAAIALFIAHALLEWQEFFGRPTPWGRRVVVFALATTVAVFWEFLEFTAASGLGLYSQLSLAETMGDLLFGCAGAAIYLGARALRE